MSNFQLGTAIIRCDQHGKVCTMVCSFKGCPHRTICSECIIQHPKNHLSKVLPLHDFDSQSTQILKTKEDLGMLRQRMAMLQNHLESCREGRKAELKRIINKIHEVIQVDIDAFHAESRREVEKFYAGSCGVVTEIVQDCERHLEVLRPYLIDGVSHTDQKKFDFLLDYQEKLLNTIIPKMAEQADITGSQAMSIELRVTEESFNKLMTNYFRKGLMVYSLLNVVRLEKQSEFSAVTDSLETFKSQKLQEFQNDKLLHQVRGTQYYKESLKPYLHTKDLEYVEYKVPQSADFNPKRELSSQVMTAKQSAIPFEVFAGHKKQVNTVLTGHEDIITCMCIVSMVNVASGCGDGLIKMWEIDSQVCVGNMYGHIGEVWDLVTISLEGVVTHLASTGKDKTIKVWSCAKMTCDFSMNGHLDVVKCLTYVPDLTQIVSGGADYKLKFWSLVQRKQVLSIDDAHIKLIRCMAHLKKKCFVLSGSSDGIMKVWSPQKGYLINQLCHGAEIMAITILSDEESMVATAGADRQIVIWNVEAAHQIRTLSGHHESVTCLDYCAAQQILLSASKDKTIRIWDPLQSKLLKSIKAHNDLISGIKFHEERNLVLTCSWDKTIRVVSLDYLMQKQKVMNS